MKVSAPVLPPASLFPFGLSSLCCEMGMLILPGAPVTGQRKRVREGRVFTLPWARGTSHFPLTCNSVSSTALAEGVLI